MIFNYQHEFQIYWYVFDQEMENIWPNNLDQQTLEFNLQGYTSF